MKGEITFFAKSHVAAHYTPQTYTRDVFFPFLKKSGTGFGGGGGLGGLGGGFGGVAAGIAVVAVNNIPESKDDQDVDEIKSDLLG